MSGPKVDLRALFVGVQSQLEHALKTNRTVIHHASAKGDATEHEWIAALRRHLPTRYSVEKAFVVDASGDCSDQIDIVIYDSHYSLTLFRQGGQIFVPAEAVYAALEVKQTLNAETLGYAGEKARSVRRLRRTSASFETKDGPAMRKVHPVIACGLLATDTSWSGGLVSSRPKLSELSQDEGSVLQLGCAIDAGSFRVGNAGPEFYPAEVALVTFFLNLVDTLRMAGNAPAIDVSAYLGGAFARPGA